MASTVPRLALAEVMDRAVPTLTPRLPLLASNGGDTDGFWVRSFHGTTLARRRPFKLIQDALNRIGCPVVLTTGVGGGLREGGACAA